MRLHSLIAVLPVLLVSGAFSPVRAQAQPSLADIARKEADRRKEVQNPAKTYTNKDLGNPPTGSPAPASKEDAGKTAAAPGAGDKDAARPADQDKGKGNDKDKAAEPVKDQAYWAGRKKQFTTQLDRDQTYADALQSRINALTTDFTARDDPAQRAGIERDRQKAINELNRLKKAIVDDKKALADLEEEARRAGVPPGWLR
jgi:hypothetical protein